MPVQTSSSQEFQRQLTEVAARVDRQFLKHGGLTRVPGEESLPEAAHWLSDELREWRESLAPD